MYLGEVGVEFHYVINGNDISVDEEVIEQLEVEVADAHVPSPSFLHAKLHVPPSLIEGNAIQKQIVLNSLNSNWPVFR